MIGDGIRSKVSGRERADISSHLTMTTSMFVSWAVFAVLLLLNNAACGCRDNPAVAKHSALFVFGDSLFDAVNNNYFNTLLRFQANFSPYGEKFFGHPTGRATDGRIIPDFISEYAGLPLIPPYYEPDKKWEYGVNFASIGGGVLDDTHPGYVINLRGQLENFMNVEKHLRDKLGDEEANALLFAAAFLLNIVSNDYFAPFQVNSSFFESRNVQREYVNRVVGNLTSVIQEIHDKGGRKFAFLSLSPIGCLPWVRAFDSPRTNDCAKDLVEIAKQHNVALSLVLQRLENQLKDFKYSTHDFFTSLNDRSENPSKYGFTAGKTACCGSCIFRGLPTCGKVVNGYDLCKNSGEFVFFDPGHATEKADEQIAKLFWSGDSNVTWPINLKSLFEIDNKCGSKSNFSSE